ncbi:transposase [Streptomyces sp. MBT62]|nr:transposase [Streptomyces sp. MBT62]
MLRLLLYGYTTGVRSSRAIERECKEDLALRYLTAGTAASNYRSISRFHRRHLDALGDLFTQSLQLAQKLGTVKMAGLPWMARSCEPMPPDIKQ